jgi:hypothetical protein
VNYFSEFSDEGSLKVPKLPTCYHVNEDLKELGSIDQLSDSFQVTQNAKPGTEDSGVVPSRSDPGCTSQSLPRVLGFKVCMQILNTAERLKTLQGSTLECVAAVYPGPIRSEWSVASSTNAAITTSRSSTKQTDILPLSQPPIFPDETQITAPNQRRFLAFHRQIHIRRKDIPNLRAS